MFLGRRKERPAEVTKNRRYEAHYDQLNDARMAQAAADNAAPCTLPRQAYGPSPLEWAPRGRDVPVWAWVQWPGRPAERIRAIARAWNDRVVIVEWESRAGRHDCVVWRNAVTRRLVR